MYSKILLPTDGSELSSAAVLAGIEFAALCRADTIGLHVAPEYQYPVSVEIIPPSYPTEEEYMEVTRRTTGEYLRDVRGTAAEKGLKYTEITAYSNKTAQKIVQVAREQECDLIFIGSHGRSGLEQLLLGSVATKVLSLCDIPVLVYRKTRDRR